MSLLEFAGVSRTFDGGRVKALVEVDFAMGPGEMVAITGPSGSGKSTLLHLAGALDHPTQGQVRFDGKVVPPQQGDELRSRGLGFVFQRHHLIEHLTARENVEVPMIPVEPDAAARARRAEALLERVGLAGRGHHYPTKLSGGEAQRVAIARALANGPRLLLMDEPTGELDSVTGSKIVDLVEELVTGEGAAVLLVTHDRNVARRCHRRIELADGRVVSDHAVVDPLREDALEFAASGLGELLRRGEAAGDLEAPPGLGAWLARLAGGGEGEGG